MEEFLIHIGLHKTGTTWLQREVFIPSNDVFEPLYPIDTKIRRDGAFEKRKGLAFDFIYDKQHNLLSSFDKNTEVIRESLQHILNQKKGLNKIFVLSHERLSGHPCSSGFDASIIANRIKEVFPDGKVLIMIREQSSNILSNYFQYIKDGGVKGIENFLNTFFDGRVPGFSENYFMYHHLISAYQELFGKDKVLVLTYELFMKDKELFFQKLSKFTGRNVSIPEDKFEVKHNIKQHHYINYRFRHLNRLIFSSSSLNDAKAPKFLLTKRLALWLMKVLKSFSNEKMDRSLKQKLQKTIRHRCEGRFNLSNKITSDLIQEDLTQYGYPCEELLAQNQQER